MWKAKGATINFCEMLRVNLHLLWMLQNLMTALKDKHVHTMYNAAVASVINFFFIIFPTNPVRPCMSWNITKIFPCWDFIIMEQGSCH